jgi:hypothetical protein
VLCFFPCFFGIFFKSRKRDYIINTRSSGLVDYIIIFYQQCPLIRCTSFSIASLRIGIQRVAKIIRTLVIISSSSDSNLMNKDSLDSFHQEESNSSQLALLAPIGHKVIAKKSQTCF